MRFGCSRLRRSRQRQREFIRAFLCSCAWRMFGRSLRRHWESGLRLQEMHMAYGGLRDTRPFRKEIKRAKSVKGDLDKKMESTCKADPIAPPQPPQDAIRNC